MDKEDHFVRPGHRREQGFALRCGGQLPGKRLRALPHRLSAGGLARAAPTDWWKAVVESTRKLLQSSKADPQDDRLRWPSRGTAWGRCRWTRTGTCCAKPPPSGRISAPRRKPPNSSKPVDPDEWYLTTGNGFPAACYTVFKVMWYRKHEPEMWQKVRQDPGHQGLHQLPADRAECKTDFSYASGTGVYDLTGWQYEPKFIAASGLPAEIWPEIVPSTQILGTLLPEAAKALGTEPRACRWLCGGVDNSCMALGAKNIRDGRVYTSLGSVGLDRGLIRAAGAG